MHSSNYPEYISKYNVQFPSITVQKNTLKKIISISDKITQIKELQNISISEVNSIIPSYLKKIFSSNAITNWDKQKLEDLVQIKTITINPEDYPDKIFHYVALENIESNTGKLLKDIKVKGIEIKSTKLEFEKGLVLYGKLRPYLNKVFVTDFKGICTTELIPLEITNNGLIAEFLAWYLRTSYFIDYAMSNVSGTRMPRLAMPALKKTKIPIPSIEIQKKIIRKLQAISNYVEQLSLLQKNTEQLVTSISESMNNNAFAGKLSISS